MKGTQWPGMQRVVGSAISRAFSFVISLTIVISLLIVSLAGASPVSQTKSKKDSSKKDSSPRKKSGPSNKSKASSARRIASKSKSNLRTTAQSSPSSKQSKTQSSRRTSSRKKSVSKVTTKSPVSKLSPSKSSVTKPPVKKRPTLKPAPPFTLSKNELRLGVGDTQDIAISGITISPLGASVNRGPSATTPAILSGISTWGAVSSDPEQLEVQTTESGFVVHAKRPGEGYITVTVNGNTQRVNYWVKHYAAVFPESLLASVNGKPALPGAVRGAVEAALKQQTSFAPMASMKFTLDYVPNLGAGVVLNVPVRIRVTAPGTIERSGTVTVKVSNLGVPQMQEEALWYCNDPERVEKPGNLFAAYLEAGKSARMLYHHINVANQGMIVRTLVINDSDTPAQIFVTPGDSAPDIDPVGAGMRAGDMFFRGWMTGSAEVLTIPPKCSIPISFRKLSPQQLISGLCAIRSQSGAGKLLVRTDAFPGVEVEPRWRAALTSSTPWREVGAQLIRDWDRSPFVLSEHIYPNPFQREEVFYKVGARTSTVRLGQKAIGRADQGGRLDGNFGVTYVIDLNLSNPLDETTDVEVAFETSAGYSGGIFMVDDEYLMTPKMLPKKQARIAKFTLSPGANRKVRIQTLPLSGSSYPATLFIRPIAAGSSNDVIDLVRKKSDGR